MSSTSPGPFVPIERPSLNTTSRWYSRTIRIAARRNNSNKTMMMMTAVNAPLLFMRSSPCLYRLGYGNWFHLQSQTFGPHDLDSPTLLDGPGDRFHRPFLGCYLCGP